MSTKDSQQVKSLPEQYRELTNKSIKLQSAMLKVLVDPHFPRIMAYRLEEQVMLGMQEEVRTVRLNGVDYLPKVEMERQDDATVLYTLSVSKEGNMIELKIQIKVYRNQVWLDVLEVNHSAKELVETIEFPENYFVSVASHESKATFSGARMSTNTHHSGDVHIDVTTPFNPIDQGFMYGFVSNEQLAAGVWSNSHYSEGKSSYKSSSNDHLRLRARSYRRDGVNVLGLTSSPWLYQRHHNGTSYGEDTWELPSAKIVITGDLNQDEQVDWQDAAIAYREIMNQPFGWETVKELVGQRIVMNFGSQAQNPFLTTIDNLKKVHSSTDGLGQSLLLKGYGSEGHDSGHLNYSDIGSRIGGEKDFKQLMLTAPDYGARLGIHINVTETYPESPYFVEELLKKEDDGKYSYGWSWIDQAINIDSAYDLAHGRFDRLKALKEVVQEGLEFIYVDVWGNGQSGDESAWPSHQLAKELNELGWRFAIEWCHSGEYDGTFHHWAVDLPYGGHELKGINSVIARFIRNHQKDVWVGDMPTYGGAANYPLLGGYSLISFEGWQGQSHYGRFIQTLFEINLPTKFIQHFVVTKWVNGEPVTMSDNDDTYEWLPEMLVELIDDSGNQLKIDRLANNPEEAAYRQKVMAVNGTVIYEPEAYLIPWVWSHTGETLAESQQKLYAYSLDKTTRKWKLLPEWQQENLYLYELTEFGRKFIELVAVVDGWIDLSLKAAVPYVLYRAEQVEEEMTYGDNTYLIDPGFNSATLNHWDLFGDTNSVTITRSQGDNFMLKISDNSKLTRLSQRLTDLKPKTTYAAYVGIDNRSEATASLSVSGGVKPVANYTKTSIAENYIRADAHNTLVENATIEDKSYFQNLYVFFTTGDNVNQVEISLEREPGEGASYFDNIRIVENHSKLFDGEHDSSEATTFTQDFENVVQGIFPFVVSGAEGIEDNRIHLSEYRAPYTQSGWNGKVISDVIEGNWSVKVGDLTGKNTLLFQTIPQNYRFEPGERYCVQFDYEAGLEGGYAFAIGEGKFRNLKELVLLPLTKTSHLKKHQTVCFEVEGHQSGQSWIGIVSTDQAGKMDEDLKKQKEINFQSFNDFVLDNLRIEHLT